MAGPVLKLRRNTTDLNLLSASSFMLDGARGGYLAGVAPETPGRDPAAITENIPTFSQVANDDAMATQEQALNAMVTWAAQYMADPSRQYPVWLHNQMRGETNERRALVRSIVYSPVRSRFDGSAGSAGARHFEHDIVIERSPYWEAVSAATPITATGVAAFGSYLACGSVAGDVPARLSMLTVVPRTSISATRRIWAGFRSRGTIANFDNLWELERGHNRVDASDAVDAAASPGTGDSCVEVSFATTETNALRCFVAMGDIVPTSFLPDYYGRFLVLLRAAVAAGTQIRMHAAFGQQIYDPTTPVMETWNTGPTVTVTGTGDYTFYEAGILTIPGHDPSTDHTAYHAGNEAIGIYAERLSGNGSLYLDCLVLIPVDEFAIVGKPLNQADYNPVIMQSDPLLQYTAVGELSGSYQCYEPPRVSGNGIPCGATRLYIVVTDSDDLSVLGDTVNVSVSWYPRYRSLRGSV